MTFDELTLSNVKASIGTDISYLFVGSQYNVMPYMTLEYGLDYSETSSQNMYYTVEGPNINYILQLDNGVKAHNWEVDLGVILEISPDMTTRVFQNVTNIFYPKLSGGCHANRDIPKFIGKILFRLGKSAF